MSDPLFTEREITRAILNCMRKLQHWSTPLNQLTLLRQKIQPGQSKDSAKLRELTGVLSDSIDEYPELHRGSLSVQLPFFHEKYPCSSSGEAAEVLRGMPVEAGGSLTKLRSSLEFCWWC